MRKIILTRGLPASGKTTWAKELLAKEPGRWKRINKDDLRAMLDGGRWSKDNEKFVLELRDQIIVQALQEDKNIIIDDTNLSPKHYERIQQFTRGFAEVEIKDFTDVSLEECIKRDQKRQNYVGEKVIRQMYNQFLKPEPVKQEWIEGLPTAIVCDIDGTLALFGDANAYERDFLQDKLNTNVSVILDVMQSHRIILVSGRKKKFEQQTRQWLSKNGVPFHDLYMPRADDDNRKDVIIKQEIYEQHIKGKYNVLFVLDDRDQVVEFWRSQGLTCLQVNYGDF